MLVAWSGIVRTSTPGFAAVFPTLLHLLCFSIAVFMACSVRHSTYSTVLAVAAVFVILLPELTELRVPRSLAFVTMWKDAASASESLALVSHVHGNPILWKTIYGSALYLLPAFILIGAIVIPTTIAAAYLVKRDISVSA